MPNFIRFTVSKCLDEITKIDAELAEVAAMPTMSRIRGTTIGLTRTHGDLERERRTWTMRLKIARRRGA